MTTQDEHFAALTRKLVAKLEQGVVPWQQPWGESGISIPRRDTGEPFTGINRLALWVGKDEMGYASDYWMTFNQAQKLGGTVRAGEHHHAKAFRRQDITRKEVNDKGDEVVSVIPYWVAYPVFNADQIDGLPDKYYAPVPQPNQGERIEAAERFFSKLGSDVRHGNYKPSYNASTDQISLPDYERFDNPESYYITRAHEEMHRSGHPSRLDRLPKLIRFGDESYAMEELVAELGATFTLAHLGIAPEPLADSAAYIGHWIKVLKSEPRAIFTAARAAEDGTRWMIEQQQDKAIAQAIAGQVEALQTQTQAER